MSTVISKSTFFSRTPPVAGSVNPQNQTFNFKSFNYKMKRIVEDVELIVGSQHMFFTPFYSTQFLFRKINKEKQSQLKLKEYKNYEI